MLIIFYVNMNFYYEKLRTENSVNEREREREREREKSIEIYSQ